MFFFFTGTTHAVQSIEWKEKRGKMSDELAYTEE